MNELRGKLTFTHNITRILESLKMMAAMNSKRSLKKYRHMQELQKVFGHESMLRGLNSKADKCLNIIIGAKSGLCGNFLIELHKFLCSEELNQNDMYCLMGGKFPKCIKEIQSNMTLDIDKDFTFALFGLVEQIWNVRHQINSINIIAWHFEDNQPVRLQFNAIEYQDAADYNRFTLETFTLLKTFILSSLVKEDKIRFFTMDQAIGNAEDMARQLQNDVNQTRQTLITNELLEIVAGSEHAGS